MAAHAYTALIQLKDDMNATGNVNWPGLEHALGYAPWADEIDFKWYQMFQQIVAKENVAALAFLIADLLPTVKQEWEFLDKPTTHEEWVERKYKA